MHLRNDTVLIEKIGKDNHNESNSSGRKDCRVVLAQRGKIDKVGDVIESYDIMTCGRDNDYSDFSIRNAKMKKLKHGRFWTTVDSRNV